MKFTFRLLEREVFDWEEQEKEDQKRLQDVQDVEDLKRLPELTRKIKELIDRSVEIWGEDKKKNHFLTQIIRFAQRGFDFQRYTARVYDLFEVARDKNVDLDKIKDFLQDDSLFNRTSKDFQYTLVVLDLLMSPEKRKKYLEDSSDLTIEDAKDRSGKILPAGVDEDQKDENTLKQILSRDLRKSKNSSKSTFTFDTLLRRVDTRASDRNSYIEISKRLIQRYFMKVENQLRFRQIEKYLMFLDNLKDSTEDTEKQKFQKKLLSTQFFTSKSTASSDQDLVLDMCKRIEELQNL